MRDAWMTAIAAALLGALVVSYAHAAGSEEAAVIADTDSSMVLAGGNVHPSHPVPENLVAAGGRIIIDQPVGQNAVLAGGSIDLRAPIGEKVRAAGGSIQLESTIAGGVSAVGGEVRLARGAVVEGYAHILAGTLTLDGRVNGPLKFSGERLIINGEVTGDVKAAAEEVVLGPGARIAGSLQYASAKEVVKSEGATIGGAVTRKDPSARDDDIPRMRHGATIVGAVISFLALLGCGALFLALAPIFSVQAPDRIKATPWKALGMGLLTVFGLPVTAILFMLTIVGIPVGVMLFMLYPIALLLGVVVGTLFVANAGASLVKLPPPPTVAAAVGYFAITLAVVLLLGKAPSVGGLVLFVLILLGVGAFEVELYRRMKDRKDARFARPSSAAA
jgi:cytoskeletal protein CcmA (bactofilin family)